MPSCLTKAWRARVLEIMQIDGVVDDALAVEFIVTHGNLNREDVFVLLHYTAKVQRNPNSTKHKTKHARGLNVSAGGQADIVV